MYDKTAPFIWLHEIGVAGFADIALMSLLLYSILVWMKRTKRAAAVLTGILIVAFVYLFARQFNLFLTAAVLQGFFAIILVALVVIFQEELRYFFEQVARWSLEPRGPLTRRKAPGGSRERVGMLVRTLTDLARDKIGALIVIRGRDLLVRHLHGGENLNGQLNEKILKSIFDPHSAGHDGAVVIEGDVIHSFGCHLPLSRNSGRLHRSGTRHAAALGLAELTDALCLVVSEERGTISVARHGNIEELGEPAALATILESYYREISAGRHTKPWSDFLKINFREKLLAVGLAVALWFVLVHESNIIYRTFSVPVEHAELPPNLSLTRLDPKQVEVTFSGQRKSFYFINDSELELVLKPWRFEVGRNVINLSSSDLSFPESLVLEKVEPSHVIATVEEKRVPGNQPR
jgi:diadenylate cyclase